MSLSIYKSLSPWVFPSFILSSLLVIESQATLWKEPQEPTWPSDAQFNFGSRQPEPTAAPIVDLELFKRQDILSLCGFVSGNSDDPLTCNTGYCGFQSSLNAVGCCSSYSVAANGKIFLSGCSYQTKCYDSTAAGQCLPGVCNSAVVCASRNYPSCVKYTWTDIGSSEFGCSTARATIAVSLLYDLTSAEPSSSRVLPPATSPLTHPFTIPFTSSSTISPTTLPAITITSIVLPPPTTNGPITVSHNFTAQPHSSIGRVSNDIDIVVAGIIGAAVLLLILVGI